MIRPDASLYDLDNIDLSIIPKNSRLDAKFKLQSLLVRGKVSFNSGHATDQNTGQAPRGLQFTLGTKTQAEIVDTITMANLGYFQLKGDPGVWNLKIRGGRSSEVYELLTIDEPSQSTDDFVIVDSFYGETLFPIVKKRQGMGNVDVLSNSNENRPGAWGIIKSLYQMELI